MSSLINVHAEGHSVSAQSAETNVTAKQEEYTKNEQCCVSHEYVAVWLELLGTKNHKLESDFHHTSQDITH